jgi:aquaporin Z
MHHPFSKYTVEFIGTLLLTLTVALQPPSGSITVGLGLTALVFMGGHVSGAYYNPAVTLAVLLSGRGKLSPADCAVYVVAQCAGAFVGALLGSAIGGAAVGVAVVETNTRLAGFAAEML